MVDFNKFKVGSIVNDNYENSLFVLAKKKDKFEPFYTEQHIRTCIAYVDKDYILSQSNSGYWVYIILNKGKYD